MARGMRVTTAQDAGLGQLQSRPLNAPGLEARANPIAFGAYQGEALQDIGQAGLRLADGLAYQGRLQAAEAERQRKIKEQEDREKEDMTVARRYLDGRLGWVERMRELQENAAPGAEGFSKGVKAEFDKHRETELAAMPTERAKMALEEKFISLEIAVMGEADSYEQQAGKAYRATEREGLAESILSAVTLRPNEYGDLLKTGMAAINGMGGSAEEKAEAGLALTHAAAEAHWMGRVRENPGAMLQALTTQEVPGLSFASRQKLINAAEVDVRQQQVEARRAAAERRADERERMADLRERTGFAMRVMEDGLTPAGLPELRKAVAGTPLAASLGAAEKAGAYAQELAVLPPGEQVARFNQLKGAPQNEGSLIALKQAQKVLQATGKAMADGTLLERAGEVGVVKLEPVDLTNAESVAARVTASRRAGQHFGVEAPVLTKGEREAYVADLQKLAPAQKVETMAAIQAAAGPAWPDIMRDLGGTHGLDRTTRYLGILHDNPAAAPVINAIVEAEQTPDKDLKLELVRSNYTEMQLEQEILAELEPFMGTIGATYGQGSGSAAGGAGAMRADLVEVAKKSAMVLMRQHSPGDAVRLATNALINDRYIFGGNPAAPAGGDIEPYSGNPIETYSYSPAASGNTWRAPKSVEPYLPQLYQAMGQAVAALTPDVLEPPGSASGVPDPVRREGYLRQIRSRGRWVTLPDESGLLLVDEQNDAVRANGQPVIVTFMGTIGAGTGAALRLR